MALIKCPECGREVSSRAVACPQCGFPVVSECFPITSGTRAGSIVTIGGWSWRVLALERDRALVITEACIEIRAYDDFDEGTTWEFCALRRYLNHEFFNSLPAVIKDRVVEATNQNPSSPRYGTAGGSATADKVFLLSVDEANTYFKDDRDRIEKNDCGKARWWWLRSPGYVASRAAVVGSVGGVHAYGYNVDSDFGGLRPALWLNL
jgi:hypothetical protein